MAMRREMGAQGELVVTWSEMPRSPGHDLAPAERLPWLIGTDQRRDIKDEGRSKGALYA